MEVTGDLSSLNLKSALGGKRSLLVCFQVPPPPAPTPAQAGGWQGAGRGLAGGAITAAQRVSGRARTLPCKGQAGGHTEKEGTRNIISYNSWMLGGWKPLTGPLCSVKPPTHGRRHCDIASAVALQWKRSRSSPVSFSRRKRSALTAGEAIIAPSRYFNRPSISPSGLFQRMSDRA